MADIQEISIDSNVYDIKAKSIVNQNSGAVKMWTGTKAQYDALKVTHIVYAWEDTDVAITVYTDSLQLYGNDTVYDSSYNIIGRVVNRYYDAENTHIVLDNGTVYSRRTADESTTTIYENRIDPNTLYNITDDTDVTLALLELLFPVGAVYFGTMATCPLQTLGVGTWQALPPDKVIQIAGTRGSVGDTLNESLPNVKGEVSVRRQNNAGSLAYSSEAFYDGGLGGATNSTFYSTDATSQYQKVKFDASRSSSAYQDNAPVQQDAYLLNGWRRIA